MDFIKRFSFGCGLGCLLSFAAIVFYMHRLGLSEEDVGDIGGGMAIIVIGGMAGVASVLVGMVTGAIRYLARRPGRPDGPETALRR